VGRICLQNTLLRLWYNSGTPRSKASAIRQAKDLARFGGRQNYAAPRGSR
jgi:hypothetical protein